jgi:RimJ/RimL family protein N-acetyltransferase
MHLFVRIRYSVSWLSAFEVMASASEKKKESRVLLRCPESRDAVDLHVAYADIEVVQYDSFVPHTTLEETQDQVECHRRQMDEKKCEA